MSSPAPFEPIAELLERSLSIRHVYGEPVNHGDTTVLSLTISREPAGGLLQAPIRHPFRRAGPR